MHPVACSASALSILYASHVCCSGVRNLHIHTNKNTARAEGRMVFIPNYIMFCIVRTYRVIHLIIYKYIYVTYSTHKR